MNAPMTPAFAAQLRATPEPQGERLREIPYNYTSFSDQEIIRRLLGEQGWVLVDELRRERKTGRSAKMLYEVLGDIWAVQRNPYLQDDLLANPKRREALIEALHHRLQDIDRRREGAVRDPQASQRDEKVQALLALARAAVRQFGENFQDIQVLRGKIKKRLARLTDPDN
ncbi:MAG: DUF3683 domain-containing protein, partial [Betaproteobacteria bacterium]|nr:DUF3683 domain-containing protein [Betaproteobacteria bacterium]